MNRLLRRGVWLGWLLCVPVAAANASANAPVVAGEVCEASDAALYGAVLSAGRVRQERERLENGLLNAALNGGDTGKATLLRSLARLKLAIGDSAGAVTDLQQAIELASDTDPQVKAALMHDLGNAFAAGERYPEAAAEYARSLGTLASGGSPELPIANRLNLARALIEAGRAAEAADPLDAAAAALAAAPDDGWVAPHAVGLGELLFRVDYDTGVWTRLDRSMQALDRGRRIAAAHGDMRTESFALGHMGRIAEEAGRTDTALEYTRAAMRQAQSANALDGLYRWQWQAARLLDRQGDGERAVAAYQQSIATLEAIRPELSRRSVRSFQATVAPVFFGMAEVLLQQQSAAADPTAGTGQLRLVRSTIEKLKVAEIQNYFQNDCVIGDEQATELDSIGADTAVLYPIIFDDRIEILVSIGPAIRRYTTPVARGELARTVLEFRQGLERRPTNRYRAPGKSLYDWLIAPALAELRAARVSTLVFVPDGPLRTVPAAAFFDGDRFLVEEFALATTLGMTLTSPRPISTQQPEILASGLTQSIRGFSALPAVQAELDSIQQIYPKMAQEFRDETFVVGDVSEALAKGRYSIVHIATHGQFKADHRESFLLAYDAPFTMSELEATVSSRRYNNEPIELLMLSACETAAGDDRAALGLAGVALKAGARSAVATLWAINDDATSQLVTRFYEEIKAGKVTKAQALRIAQLQLIGDQRYSHPAVWSPFLMLGNWL
jgi:CHAT domain-containing protein